MDDMILITPEDGHDSLAETIVSVQKQLSDMRRELDHLYTRVQAGELDQISNAAKTVVEIRQWLKLAIEAEVQLEKRTKEKDGIVHDFAVNLDEARSSIWGRLDRLRRTGGD